VRSVAPTARRGENRFRRRAKSDIQVPMPTSQRALLLGLLAASICIVAACGGGDDSVITDPDAPGGCNPAAILPSNYRPIPSVSTGMLQVTTTGGVTSGTADATAGGLSASADNPYLYLDLKAGTKVAINDLDARMSMAWDISLKRASLRVNGGDSGTGGRKLAVVQAAMLSAVTAAPTSGYAADDFTDMNCQLLTLPAGEPASAFGEWYNYDPNTHVVTPKSEVYVIERADGSHTALRLITYYGDASMPMRGAYYQVEWKQL
jgi:heme-binding HmuY-like protein